MDTRAYLCAMSALLLLGLAPCLLACAGLELDDSRAFLLRSDTLGVAEVAGQFTAGIASQLEQSPSLREGYPILGHVELIPQPSDPGAQVLRCTPGPVLLPRDSRCIRLNERGDFVRAQAVTWQSAAFYMYRVYVAPKALFARVDPARNFVGVDVFILEEAALGQVVDEAIRDAARRMGARPFHP
jgi:hypothetical protein